MPTLEQQKRFRVIIVGSGIAGLALAHALQRADIDCVVLEKQSQAVSLNGAAILLWPHVSRILDQFGCLEELERASEPVSYETFRNPDGSVLAEPRLFSYLEEKYAIHKLPTSVLIPRFGYRPLSVDRQVLIRTLYNKLPDKSQVLLNKRAQSITHTDNGVQVTLADNTVEEGDIVIGADGVHSIVRQLMWDHANTLAPNTITAAEKTSLVTTYKGLFGCSPCIAGFGRSEFHVGLNKGFSFLVFAQPDQIFWTVFLKNEKETRWPTTVKYTDKDAEDVAAQLLEVPITKTVLFGQLWKSRIKAGLVSLEEGVLDHWHSGRIALIGDAVHKMTPDLALGAACAMEDAAVLANLLHRELKKTPSGKPSAQQITDLFQYYQNQRKRWVTRLYEISGQTMRRHTWETIKDQFFTRYLLPRNLPLMATGMAVVISRGPLLDYLPLSQVRAGNEHWKVEVDENGWPMEPKASSKKAKKGGPSPLSVGLTLAAAAGTMWAFNGLRSSKL